MTVRPISPGFARQPVRFACGKAAAIAIAAALVGTAAHAAGAAASAAASAPISTSQAAPSSGTHYTVKPGQSLNDVAIDITQSHDRSVLKNAAKAVFDANPRGFMKGDPSRMKIGAVLEIPPLDAAGNVAAAAPASVGAASSVAPASSPAGVTASAGMPGTAAAALAHGASSTAPTAAASSAVPVAASSAVPASAAALPASHPEAVSAASMASGAAGQQGWSGAIQPAASVPAAAAASAAVVIAAPAASAHVNAASSPAPAVVQSQPHVSSLQQLLALKNRVLMELQRHGFGKAQPAPGNRAQAANGQIPADRQAPGIAVPNAASGAASVVAPARGSTLASWPKVATGTLSFNGWQIDLGALWAAAAALLVLLVVLVVGLIMRGRRRRAAIAAAAEGALASEAPDSAERNQASAEHAADEESASVAISHEGRESSSEPAEPSAHDAGETEWLATLAENPNSKMALMGLAALYAERGDVTGFGEIARRIHRLSGGRGPNWQHVASLGRQLDPHDSLFALYAERAPSPAVDSAPLEPGEPDVRRESMPAPADGHAPTAETFAADKAEEGGIESRSQAGDEAQGREVQSDVMGQRGESDSDKPASREERVETAAATSTYNASSNDEYVETAADAFRPNASSDDEGAKTAAAASAFNASPNDKNVETVAAASASNALPNDRDVETAAAASTSNALLNEEHVETASATSTSNVSPSGEDADVLAPPVLATIGESNQTAAPSPLVQAAEPVLSPDGAAPRHDVEDARDLPQEPIISSRFPSEAIAALDSLELALPPRAEPVESQASSHDDITLPPASLATQPVVVPEVTAKGAVPMLDGESPREAETIDAGIAGPASVAGLGAARFGAMNLDFDLDLPATASPLPTFTSEQLAQIARNKLDLAAEYIALGDLGGARTLINEVIESNDAATRNDARALLATLAPLS